MDSTSPKSTQIKLQNGKILKLPELYIAKNNSWLKTAVKPSAVSKAGMAYYKAELKKYTAQLNRFQKQIIADNGKQEKEKMSKKKRAAIEKQINVLKSKITKLNRKYKDKDSKAHYKRLQNKYARQRGNTAKNLTNENMYREGYPYLMPNNPHTDNSYAFLFLTDESNPQSNNISSVTPENGMSKTTTTMQNPSTVTLTGTFAPPMGSDEDFNSRDYADKLYKQITHWTKNASDMKYCGNQLYDSCVITDFSPDIPMGPDGAVNAINFSLTLTLTSYFDDTNTKKQGKTKHRGKKGIKKGKKTNNSGRKNFVTAKNGDTYTSIARAKGVSVSEVKSKNSYDDTKIPIGSKIYY